MEQAKERKNVDVADLSVKWLQYIKHDWDKCFQKLFVDEYMRNADHKYQEMF